MDIIRNPKDWVLGVPRHVVVHLRTRITFELAPAREGLAAVDCLVPEDFIARPVDTVAAARLPREELEQLAVEARLMVLTYVGFFGPFDELPHAATMRAA